MDGRSLDDLHRRRSDSHDHADHRANGSGLRRTDTIRQSFASGTVTETTSANQIRRQRMVEDLWDPRRVEPPFVLPERDMLERWLEFHRTTLLLKCEGVDEEALKARPVSTSKLSLHGLVRHMAEVERNWFQRTLRSAPDTPYIWLDRDLEDSELVPLDDADWDADLQVWQRECEVSRQVAAEHALDA